jgi:hypothetical protein
VRALRVNIENLRPWEYDEMVADEYDMISHLQGLYRKEAKFAADAAERLDARRRR